MALILDTTQPAHRVVSSVQVDPGEGHDFVHVFNRGTRAGTIVVQKGDGAEIARRLQLDPMRVLAGVQAALAPLLTLSSTASGRDLLLASIGRARSYLEQLEAELVKLGSK